MQLSPNFPGLDLIVFHAVYIAPGDNIILHVQSPQGFLYPFLGSDCFTFGHCVYGYGFHIIEVNPVYLKINLH